MRESYTFYRSFIEGLRDADDATFRKLIEAISNYALDEIEPELSGLEYGIFRSWKANIDASNKRKDNGKLGGRPKTETKGYDEKTIGYKEETIGYENNNHRLEVVKPNKKEKENKTENITEKEKEKRTRFEPPSPEEVKAYCKERNNNVDPDRFIDFYASKGWKVGNQPMKDWKACVRTWERRDDRASPKEEKGRFDDIAARLINESMYGGQNV